LKDVVGNQKSARKKVAPVKKWVARERILLCAQIRGEGGGG